MLEAVLLCLLLCSLLTPLHDYIAAAGLMLRDSRALTSLTTLSTFGPSVGGKCGDKILKTSCAEWDIETVLDADFTLAKSSSAVGDAGGSRGGTGEVPPSLMLLILFRT